MTQGGERPLLVVLLVKGKVIRALSVWYLSPVLLIVTTIFDVPFAMRVMFGNISLEFAHLYALLVNIRVCHRNQ